MDIPNWWNLDLALAKIIAQELRVFVDNTMSHPHGTTHDEWKAKLADIAIRLEDYTSGKFSDNEEAITLRAQAALRDFADVFPYLWD